MQRTREDRVEHAKRLYVSGMPIKDIAKLAATKAGTVEQWARRYGWKPEKEAIKLAELSDRLPGLLFIDDLRLKGAYALYSAVVEARIEYVNQWVKNRRRYMEEDNVLSCLGSNAGKYCLPSKDERTSFCDDIKAMNELISDSRMEIDSLRSNAQTTGTTSQETDSTPVDISNEPHLRMVQ